MSKYCLDISLNENIWIIVDILELCAYHCGEASIENIGRLFDIRREHEDEDYEGKDTLLDTYLDNLYAEVAYRIEQIGDAYPFDYSSCETKLVFKNSDDLSPGSYVYLFCLILSNISSKKINNITITNNERNLFEYCSVAAVAGTFNAHAYHFGFPCDDNSGFLNRLKTIFEDNLQNGKVVSQFHAGSSPYIKDGELDVIAWPTNWRPGHPLHLIQCASGANWETKSLMHFKATREFDEWFTRTPNIQMSVGISIPFDLHPEHNGTRKDIESLRSVKFGYILWRNTLPGAVNKGVLLFNQGNAHVDKISKLNDIKTWVVLQRNAIGACA